MWHPYVPKNYLDNNLTFKFYDGTIHFNLLCFMFVRIFNLDFFDYFTLRNDTSPLTNDPYNYCILLLIIGYYLNIKTKYFLCIENLNTHL